MERDARLDVRQQVLTGARDDGEGVDRFAHLGRGRVGRGLSTQAGLPERFPRSKLAEDVVAVPLPAVHQLGDIAKAAVQPAGDEPLEDSEEALAVLGAAGVLGEGKRRTGAATAGLGRALGGRWRDTARHERVHDLPLRDRADVDTAAAAEDRLDDRLRGGAYECENGVPWRLLQRLQEGVRSLVAQALRRFDDDDARRGLEGIARGEVDDPAHLADADVAREGVRLVPAVAGARAAEAVTGFDGQHVRVGALGDEAAGAAFAAGDLGWRGSQVAEERGASRGRAPLAVQHHGELAGEQFAAGAFGAGEKEGMGRLGRGGERAQFAQDGAMSDERFAGHGPSVRWAAVCPHPPAPSPTGVGEGETTRLSPRTRAGGEVMMAAMAGDPIDRVRAICLGLPEAEEQLTWGIPTFRVRGKIFVMASEDGAAPTLSCKAPPGAQEVLVGADPGRFYRPPYVGKAGWIGVRLHAGVDWNAIAGFIADSYRMTAPKRLAALVR